MGVLTRRRARRAQHPHRQPDQLRRVGACLWLAHLMGVRRCACRRPRLPGHIRQRHAAPAPAAQHHHWPAFGCTSFCSKLQQFCEGSAESLPGARTCAAPGAERARGCAAAPGLVILCAGLLLPDTPASYAERGHFDKARNVRPAPPCWPRLRSWAGRHAGAQFLPWLAHLVFTTCTSILGIARVPLGTISVCFERGLVSWRALRRLRTRLWCGPW